MENLKTLLKLARMSILEEFENKKLIDKNKWIEKYPFLAKKRACFVTLKLKDKPRGSNLRGCIGSILPYRPLIDDVIANAKAAAFNDPRFTPLTPQEFDRVKIEVSVLTIPKQLEYKDIADLKNKIKIKKTPIVLLLKVPYFLVFLLFLLLLCKVSPFFRKSLCPCTKHKLQHLDLSLLN